MISRGELPAKAEYRDELCLAFHDIQPKAQVHLLIIPHRHIPSINELRPEDEALVGHMALVAAQLAAKLGVDQSGYRLIYNVGRGAGQTVFHIHMHLLAGGQLSGF
jgi:histidine triad (HIT) family protein